MNSSSATATPTEQPHAGNGRPIERNGRFETAALTAAFDEAVARAVETHRRADVPLAVARDGRPCWVDADGNEVPAPDWAPA